MKYTILAVLVAGVFAAVPARRETAGESIAQSSCSQTMQTIESQRRMILTIDLRLADLMRQASRHSESVVAEIERFRAAQDERLGQITDRLDAIISRTCGRMMLESCLSTYCDRLASDLETISRYLRDLASRASQFEASIRTRLATVEQASREILVTDQMLTRAVQAVRRSGADPDAFAGLRRAYDVQEDAKQALGTGGSERALRLTFSARDIIGEAVKAAADSSETVAVARRAHEYYRTAEALVSRIASRIDPERNPREYRMLEMARAELDKARELLADNPYAAIRAIATVRRIVSEIEGVSVRVDNVDARLLRVDERLESARTIVEESADEKAAAVYRRAMTHYERARQLAASANERAAASQLDIATSLSARSVEIARGTQSRNRQLEREFARTERLINYVYSIARSDAQKEAVAQARALLARAREQQDNPRAAMTLLDKATELALAIIARSEASSEPTRIVEEDR